MMQQALRDIRQLTTSQHRALHSTVSIDNLLHAASTGPQYSEQSMSILLHVQDHAAAASSKPPNCFLSKFQRHKVFPEYLSSAGQLLGMFDSLILHECQTTTAIVSCTVNCHDICPWLIQCWLKALVRVDFEATNCGKSRSARIDS